MEDEQQQIKKNIFFGNLLYWKLNPKTDFALDLHKQVLTVLYKAVTLDNIFKFFFCICNEYVINLFVCIYEVRKGT
jgi:hypothetical protein